MVLRDSQESTGHVATHIGLTAVNSDSVMTLVRDGIVALGFIETPNIPADLRRTTIGRDVLQVAVSPTHPWARRRQPLTAEELARTPLVTREEGSGTRKVLENLFEPIMSALGESTPPRWEYSSTAAVRSAIASGTGPGVLSSVAIADDVALGRLVTVPVSGVTLTRRLSAVWASGPRPTQVPAQDLITIAKRALAR
ncbi:LysR substrate-binding domain-containing protein [Cryobacterium zongtaii]|uniref:LysR substrate-binding domain-containing protein n=1 Tax=Cryobacterium zongtaii TaxID=1259217 RepID=UPI003C2B9FCD